MHVVVGLAAILTAVASFLVLHREAARREQHSDEQRALLEQMRRKGEVPRRRA
jgi:hypothetical protein